MPTRLRKIRGKRTRKPVVLPEGFRRWWVRKLKRKVPGLKSPYKFAMWTLSRHMKKGTVKRLVAEYRKRRR
jgi:hypothetical protein